MLQCYIRCLKGVRMKSVAQPNNLCLNLQNTAGGAWSRWQCLPSNPESGGRLSISQCTLILQDCFNASKQMGHGVGVWKPTPASALLSSPPSLQAAHCCSKASRAFFLWVGGGTNYSQRGHIACANSLSEGVEEDRMEGSALLDQAFMGSFINAQPLSLSLSLSLNPHSTPSCFPDWIYGWPPSYEHSNRRWKGAHTACTSNTGFYDTLQDQRRKARENSHWANKTNARKRIPSRFHLRCYCHSQTTSLRAGKAAGEWRAFLGGNNCSTTGKKLLGALSP